MRKRLSQIRNMLTTVKQFFTNNSAIFTSHPALNALITVYLNKLTLIDQKLIELGEVASGKMDEKEAARAFLQDEYAEIYASNLYMFGKNSGNGTIAEICDVKEWQFDQMPDPEFIDKCTAIHSIAVNKVAELADYNITAEKNTSFNNKIQEFRAHSIHKQISSNSIMENLHIHSNFILEYLRFYLVLHHTNHSKLRGS